jgi:HlyD family secretion protein
LDRMKFRRISLEAQLAVAETGVQQAEARLKNSQANLQYTDIRSPVDGQIIDRRVEPGQTVAATFATPILFVVTPDLAGEMHVFAKVDEADIGLVREAQDAGRPVRFTVDAYPEEEFVGKIKQIRSRSSTIESVVTFPVVVTTTNQNRKLLPGMTGNLLFTTAVKDNALRVPNTAIRFYPPAQQVRIQDRRLLDPEAGIKDDEAAEAGGDETQLTIAQLRNRRHGRTRLACRQIEYGRLLHDRRRSNSPTGDIPWRGKQWLRNRRPGPCGRVGQGRRRGHGRLNGRRDNRYGFRRAGGFECGDDHASRLG